MIYGVRPTELLMQFRSAQKILFYNCYKVNCKSDLLIVKSIGLVAYQHLRFEIRLNDGIQLELNQ